VDIVESKTQKHLPCTAKKKEKDVKKYRKERSGKERTSSSTKTRKAATIRILNLVKNKKWQLRGVDRSTDTYCLYACMYVEFTPDKVHDMQKPFSFNLFGCHAGLAHRPPSRFHCIHQDHHIESHH